MTQKPRAVPPLISICIPAWERPVLLLHAVRSCLNQTYSDIEVIVADDSRSRAVADALAPLLSDPRVRYVHNGERLGQAGNVNKLFTLAKGERLVVLHDDNVLVPDAIEILDSHWRTHPGLLACYGKQTMVTERGQPLQGMSTLSDQRFFRTAPYAGLQSDKLWCAMVDQPPSDGYLIRTSAALNTGFRAPAEVGDYCDYDFMLRLTRESGEFFFLNRCVSEYRYVPTRVSSESATIDYIFLLIKNLQLPNHLEALRHELLQARVSFTVRRFLLAGQRSDAWELISGSELWKAQPAPMRLTDLFFYVLPTPAVRAIYALRRATGKLIRSHDVLFRLLDWVRLQRAAS